MLRCVRSTIRLADRVLRDLKKFFARTAVGHGRPKAPPFRVITFKGRLQPGVDLDDSGALLDVMEGTGAPRRQ
jgi:hypothetical protein